MIALQIYFEFESLSLTHTIHASYDEDTKRKKDILMKTITIFGKGNMGTAIGFYKLNWLPVKIFLVKMVLR